MIDYSKIDSPDIFWELNMPIDNNGNYIVIPPKKNYSSIDILNKRNYPNGYIYFIRCIRSDFYKLGVSQNPKRRICDIDSYLPFDISILSLHYFENVYDIEDLFSKQLENKNVRREWYKLTIEEASKVMIDLHNLNVINNAPNKNI